MTKRAQNKVNKMVERYEAQSLEELLTWAVVNQWEDEDVDGQVYELENGEVVVVLNNGEAYVE